MVDKVSDKITSTIIGKVFQKEVNASWVASLFIQGLGQMLLGDINRGILFMIGEVLSFLVYIGIRSSYTGDSRFLIPLFVFLGIHIWNVVDAYLIADNQSKLISENIKPDINPTFLVNKDDYIKLSFYSLSF